MKWEGENIVVSTTSISDELSESFSTQVNRAIGHTHLLLLEVALHHLLLPLKIYQIQ
jgi:hypothetical protein